MNRFEATMVRRLLKPTVLCDLPGRLRLGFSSHKLLPAAALPYLHYVREAYLLVEGVQDARVNPRIGTLTILYDRNALDGGFLLEWTRTMVDEGIRIVSGYSGPEPMDGEQVILSAKPRLISLLSPKKEQVKRRSHE